MRRNIVHEGASQLHYEIREIVGVAHQLSDLGKDMDWENIGDPIQKGEEFSPWMKEIIGNLVQEDRSYGYTDSQGEPDTRQFLAELASSRFHSALSKDDVIFFNGLGDAVAKIFGFLKREARVIGPSPAYSTHSSAEAAHSGYEHLVYRLNPDNNWLPDLEDLRLKVKYNDAIAGILLINPDNPTGIVYPRDLLQEIVEIAEEFKLFIICDETYANVVFPGQEWTFLSEVIRRVPAISMRSVSKEYPWPGARCGWIEVYNRKEDEEFNTYINSLVNAKRLEVCSTTLPQLSIPLIMGDPRYREHLNRRAAMLANRADEAADAFTGIAGVTFARPQGAMYFTVLFEEGVLNDDQLLPINDVHIKNFVEARVSGLKPDKRLVYYLMGAAGVCVVPLSGFYSNLMGFRMTLLENNDNLRREVYARVAAAVGEYLKS